MSVSAYVEAFACFCDCTGLACFTACFKPFFEGIWSARAPITQTRMIECLQISASSPSYQLLCFKRGVTSNCALRFCHQILCLCPFGTYMSSSLHLAHCFFLPPPQHPLFFFFPLLPVIIIDELQLFSCFSTKDYHIICK